MEMDRAIERQEEGKMGSREIGATTGMESKNWVPDSYEAY